MALELFFVVQDSDGEKSTIHVPFASATPLTVASALIPAVAALIHPLVTGGLVSAGVSLEFAIPSWGPTAMLDSDVQEKVEFSSRTSLGNVTRINLPTVAETVFSPGTGVGDLTNPDLAAFKDLLEDGITVSATLCQPSDHRSEDIVTVETIKENWGRRRR